MKCNHTTYLHHVDVLETWRGTEIPCALLNRVVSFDHNHTQIHLLKLTCLMTKGRLGLYFYRPSTLLQMCLLENQLGSTHSAHSNPPFLSSQAVIWPDFPGMWTSLINGDQSRGQTMLNIFMWDSRSS